MGPAFLAGAVGEGEDGSGGKTEGTQPREQEPSCPPHPEDRPGCLGLLPGSPGLGAETGLEQALDKKC